MARIQPESALGPAPSESNLPFSTDKMAGITEWGKMPYPHRLPVSGPLTSLFGLRVDPITQICRMHQGLDIGAQRDQPVDAIWPGTVIESVSHASYGEMVRVDHGGGITTLYAHLSKRLVAEGDVIDTGQVLGWAGDTGRASGVHLHFETHLADQPVNPLALVSWLTMVPPVPGGFMALYQNPPLSPEPSAELSSELSVASGPVAHCSRQKV